MPLHPLQTEWDADLTAGDPPRLPRLRPAHRDATEESVVTGRTQHYAFVEGRFDVLGGSMGAAHGERVVRAYRRAADERLPVVVVTSGGARMQEGMVALVQMARTTAAARDHAGAGLQSVAVHRHPTTGGVFASYGSLADVRAAEPGATVGFAGPACRRAHHRRRCPRDRTPPSRRTRPGWSTPSRGDQPAWVETALGLQETPLALAIGGAAAGFAAGPYGEVQRARDERRPSGYEWAARLTSSWTELHGTDPVMRAGLATIDGRRLVVVAMHSRGPATPPAPGPAGYRLAQRAIALAGRLALPVLTLVDTRGADPGAESEAGGIAGEIARTFAAMDALPTPSVSVCVGEGRERRRAGARICRPPAHPGARHLLGDRARGAAAILERDATKAPDVAPRLKLTSEDLLRPKGSSTRSSPGPIPQACGPPSSAPSRRPGPATGTAGSTPPPPGSCADVRRPKALVLTATAGVVAGVLIFVGIVSLVGSGKAKSHLAADVFKVGKAKNQAAVVDRRPPVLRDPSRRAVTSTSTTSATTGGRPSSPPPERAQRAAR